MEEQNLPQIDEPLADLSDAILNKFSVEAMTLIESHLETNRDEADAFTDVEKTLDEVLANHNTRSLEIRAQPLENPKVTLCLKDCPVWANDSWRETFHPFGLNHYNGKVTVTLDVRPF
jgi:wobble nucleotide-excising tRNase